MTGKLAWRQLRRLIRFTPKYKRRFGHLILPVQKGCSGDSFAGLREDHPFTLISFFYTFTSSFVSLNACLLSEKFLLHYLAFCIRIADARLYPAEKGKEKRKR
jgi:hypothetical protein